MNHKRNPKSKMSTSATSMLSRIAALEARVTAVESENEMLKENLARLGEAPAKVKGKKAVLSPEEKAKKNTNLSLIHI